MISLLYAPSPRRQPGKWTAASTGLPAPGQLRGRWHIIRAIMSPLTALSTSLVTTYTRSVFKKKLYGEVRGAKGVRSEFFASLSLPLLRARNSCRSSRASSTHPGDGGAEEAKDQGEHLLGDGDAHHRKRRDDLRLVVREHLAPCAAILGRHVVAQTILRGI